MKFIKTIDRLPPKDDFYHVLKNGKKTFFYYKKPDWYYVNEGYELTYKFTNIFNDILEWLDMSPEADLTLEQAKKLVHKENLRLAAIKEENKSNFISTLADYFANNTLMGCKLEEYEARFDWNNVEIHPIKPYWDECYQDDIADAELRTIGDKYGYYVYMAGYCYHK